MKTSIIALLVSVISLSLSAQEDCYVPEFEDINEVETTICKSQGRTGTCWSFATSSLIETELLRLTGQEYDISEMYFVHHKYLNHGKRFVRFNGTINFSEGGLAHDVMDVVRDHGFVTQDAYPERYHGKERLNHKELSKLAEAFLKQVCKHTKDELSTAWFDAYKGIIEAYLGPLPASITVDGQKMSPKEFASKINPDDYVELTSYTHHPFYSRFVLETSDNWSQASYYNLPLDELIQTMKHALDNGYSFAWDGDVGNKHFHHSDGWAMMDTDSKGIEDSVSQQMRQMAFNSFRARDEHLMHTVGTSYDEEGMLFFITKNSWGTGNEYEGKVHMSEQFCRYYTISIMLHKEAIPPAIRTKLGI